MLMLVLVAATTTADEEKLYDVLKKRPSKAAVIGGRTFCEVTRRKY